MPKNTHPKIPPPPPFSTRHSHFRKRICAGCVCDYQLFYYYLKVYQRYIKFIGMEHEMSDFSCFAQPSMINLYYTRVMGKRMNIWFAAFLFFINNCMWNVGDFLFFGWFVIPISSELVRHAPQLKSIRFTHAQIECHLFSVQESILRNFVNFGHFLVFFHQCQYSISLNISHTFSSLFTMQIATVL